MAASTSFQNTGLKQYKIVKGIFQIPYKSMNDTFHESDSSEEEEDEEFDDTSLYFPNTDNFVSRKIPKEVKVVIKSENGRTHNCTGKFPLTQMFWQVEAHVDSRWFLRLPPAYAIIRDDEYVRKTNLVTIFLSECFSSEKRRVEEGNVVKACFEAFCIITGKNKNLSFTNLENILSEYLKLETLECCLVKLANVGFGYHDVVDHSECMEKYVMGSELGSVVLLSASHPKLVRICTQLLPYTFLSFLHKLRTISMKNTVNPTKTIQLAEEMATIRPWEYAFKDILATKLKIYGTEAKLQHYEQADYLAMTPQTEKDAIYIYHVLKEDSQRNGNMCIGFKNIRRSKLFQNVNYNVSSTDRWCSALEYLEQNKVIKCEEFNFDKLIFLRHNWQAEVDTADSFATLLKKHKKDPLVWDIDFQSPEFDTIRKDPDQLKASHLISHLPITVVFGRGGCGKTTVVTNLLQYLRAKEEARLKEIIEGVDFEKFDIFTEDTVSEPEELPPNNSSTAACSQNDLPPINSSTAACSQNDLPPINSSTTACSQNDLPLNNSSTTACSQNDLPLNNSSTTACSQNDLPLNNSSTTACSQNDLPLNNSSTTACSQNDLPPNNSSTTSSYQNDLPPNNSSTTASNQKAVSKTEKMCKELISDLVKILKNSRPFDHMLMCFQEQFLLTAPTGKAARLLGCKAKLPSVTLHSVIMSWRMYRKSQAEKGAALNSWRYERVQVLVVDECSLVSVRLFAMVIKILLERAKLQKIILLGDFRQLPSIEPGEFLKDVYKTLHCCGESEFGLSIELQQNHRSESALIVENAGKISNQVMPTFDPAQKFQLLEISDSRDDGERDQLIRNLLIHVPDVKSDVDSQFVSFRNAHCKAVNELCCLHYNGHSITKSQTGRRKARYDFQIGDKICLGKNNLVINSRRHMIDKYMKEYPEFQKAFKEALQKREEQDKKFLSETSQSLSGLKLNKTVLDDTSALNLILADDETFNTTINNMREDDLKVEENRAELEKIERLKRAEQKKAEWTAKSSQRVNEESLLGESSEKLCNGEVFFIMDEFNEIDRNGKHIQYFVLSDRDPEIPRVVCVPVKQLRHNCRMKHSWARTIHTYQGSESRTVVYVLGQAMPQNWQHVYTAITRGKSSVYIVGSHNQLLTAIHRNEAIRFSQLKTRLKEMLLQNSDCIEMCRQQFIKSFHQESTSDFSFGSEQWSESILSQCLQLEEEVEAEKNIKDETADTNLEMTHCNARDSLIYKSGTVQSYDPNKQLSTNVNTGISSEDTQDNNEFQDDDPQLELMMAEMDDKFLNDSDDDELSQCVLQAPKQELGKLSNVLELNNSTNQIISNASEYDNDSIDSSDSEVEYRIFESVSKSKARRSKEFLSSPGSLSVPSQKSPRDLGLSPKHEASRPSLNVTPPRSAINCTPEDTCLTSPQKRLCIDTPFHNSFTNSMSLHDEVEDDESPPPRKTPSVCRKL